MSRVFAAVLALATIANALNVPLTGSRTALARASSTRAAIVRMEEEAPAPSAVNAFRIKLSHLCLCSSRLAQLTCRISMLSARAARRRDASQQVREAGG